MFKYCILTACFIFNCRPVQAQFSQFFSQLHALFLLPALAAAAVVAQAINLDLSRPSFCSVC